MTVVRMPRKLKKAFRKWYSRPVIWPSVTTGDLTRLKRLMRSRRYEFVRLPAGNYGIRRRVHTR